MADDVAVPAPPVPTDVRLVAYGGDLRREVEEIREQLDRTHRLLVKIRKETPSGSKITLAVCIGIWLAVIIPTVVSLMLGLITLAGGLAAAGAAAPPP